MGRYDLADIGSVVHLPVLDGALIRENAHNGSLDLTSMYQAVVFDHADEIAAVLTLLSDPRPRSIASGHLVHRRKGPHGHRGRSAARRPRGSRRSHSCRLRTVDSRSCHTARPHHGPPRRRRRPHIPAAAFAIEPAAVSVVLQDIRTRHGTITDYLIGRWGANRHPAAVGRTLRRRGCGNRTRLPRSAVAPITGRRHAVAGILPATGPVVWEPNMPGRWPRRVAVGGLPGPDAYSTPPASVPSSASIPANLRPWQPPPAPRPALMPGTGSEVRQQDASGLVRDHARGPAA